jgi:hypothetical protein
MDPWGRIMKLARAIRGAAPPEAEPSAPEPGSVRQEETGPRGIDRRQFPRFGVSVPVFISRPGETPMRALIRDISEGGCLLETEGAMTLGTNVAMAFLMKPHGFCRASGRVVRVTGTSGFGVKFSDINEGLLQFVATIAATPPQRRSEVIKQMMGSVLELDSNVQTREVQIHLGPSSHSDLVVMSRLSGKTIPEIVEELIEDWSRRNSRALQKARKRAAAGNPPA